MKIQAQSQEVKKRAPNVSRFPILKFYLFIFLLVRPWQLRTTVIIIEINSEINETYFGKKEATDKSN